MKRYVAASLLLVALATPAFAAEHFAVVDTVGNCSVIDTKPSPYSISGLKVLGDQSGYSSPSDASKALNSDSSQCKGMIQRA
jgi:opacity protein-like surface antigen